MGHFIIRITGVYMVYLHYSYTYRYNIFVYQRQEHTSDNYNLSSHPHVAATILHQPGRYLQKYTPTLNCYYNPAKHKANESRLSMSKLAFSRQ